MSDIIILPQPQPFAIPASYGTGGTTGGKGDPGGNVMAIGLLKDANGVSVSVGTDLVQTSGSESVGVGVGQYVADATVDAAYVAAHPKSGFVSSNGRGFRVISEAPHLATQFYEATDPDFGPAMQRVVDYSKATAVNDVAGFTKASRKIKIPDGYFDVSSTTTEVTHVVEIEGETSGASGVALATELYSAAGTVFRVKADPGGYTGAGTILRALGIFGGAGAEGEIHGVDVLASMSIERCAFGGFRGDAIHANDTAGVTGNANHCFVTQSSAANCRNGLFIDGADTNAWTVIGFNAQSNRRWGIWDSSFLGNTYLGGESDSNGITSGSIATVVTDGTFLYCVVKDQGAGASLNPPSTGVDNAYWYCFGFGGVDPTHNIDVWSSGTTYRDGGSVRGDGSGNAANLFAGIYTESDQGCPQIEAPAVIIGGQLAKVGNRGAPSLYTSGNGLISSIGLGAVGNLGVAGSSHTLGPDSGTATDLDAYLQNTNNISRLFFRRWAAGVHYDDGVLASTSSAFYVAALAQLILQVNSVDIAHITSTALTMQTDKAIVGSNSAAPTTGTHARGEIVFNSAPSAAGKVGWVCTTAGSPGTWKPFGVIDA